MMNKENDPVTSANPINILDLPSATTAIFLLLLAMSFVIVTPLGQTGFSGIILAGVIITVIVLISLRLFINAPDQWIAKNQFCSLNEIAPELVSRVNSFAKEMHLRRAPALLHTESRDVPLQAFGTFNQYYIIVNNGDLLAAKELNASDSLDTMLIHELAHIKNGDVWKLQFAKQVVRVYWIFSILLLIAGPITLFGKWVTGNPSEMAGDIAALSLYPILIGMTYYLLGLMSDIREHYADNVTERFRGADSIIKALTAATLFRNFNTKSSDQTSKSSSHLSDLALIFFSRGNIFLKRLGALQKGAHFHKSMRHVMFAGGLALGLPSFSLVESGVYGIYGGFFIVGIYLTLVYLLPYITNNRTTWSQIAKQAVIANLLFLGGIISTYAFFIFSDVIAMVVVKTLPSTIYSQFLNLVRIGLILISSIGIMIFTLQIIGLPIIRLLYQGMRSDILPTSWVSGLVIVPMALVIGTVAILFDISFWFNAIIKGNIFNNLINLGLHISHLVIMAIQVLLLLTVAFLSTKNKSRLAENTGDENS